MVQLFERLIVLSSGQISIQRIMHFPNTYPPDRDLSVGERYPTFRQLGPGVFVLIQYYSVVLILKCF